MKFQFLHFDVSRRTDYYPKLGRGRSIIILFFDCIFQIFFPYADPLFLNSVVHIESSCLYLFQQQRKWRTHRRLQRRWGSQLSSSRCVMASSSRVFFVWCAAKPRVMMYFHFRTSKVYSYLTISSVGIVSSRVVGTLESSYSIPTPASIGEKRLQGSLALLPQAGACLVQFSDRWLVLFSGLFQNFFIHNWVKHSRPLNAKNLSVTYHKKHLIIALFHPQSNSTRENPVTYSLRDTENTWRKMRI